jgi:hypothetical protein
MAVVAVVHAGAFRIALSLKCCLVWSLWYCQ